MKKIFSFLILVMTVGFSFAQKEVIRDAHAEPRTGSFHAIEISNAFDLYLSQGDKCAVAISASGAEYRDRIRTEVSNGILKIGYEDNRRFRTKGRNLKAYVSFKELDRLSASGACDLKISGIIKSDELSVSLSGASDLKGAVNVGSLTIDLSGASDVEVNGNAISLKVKASGASEFKGFDFRTDNCNASASGASDIHVTVNKELNAYASGASGIAYRGNGTVRGIKSSGSSHISRKD